MSRGPATTTPFAGRATVRSAALSMLVALGTPHAGSADTIPWKTVGRWDISYYPGAAGCQAFAVFGGRTAFFIGFDGRAGALWLDITLLDRRWSHLEPGKTYDVTVRFGRQSPWSITMEGLVIDEFPGLNILIDPTSDQAQRLVAEFQRMGSMEWSLDGQRLGHYRLTGSFRAFDAVRACQAKDRGPRPVSLAR